MLITKARFAVTTPSQLPDPTFFLLPLDSKRAAMIRFCYMAEGGESPRESGIQRPSVKEGGKRKVVNLDTLVGRMEQSGRGNEAKELRNLIGPAYEPPPSVRREQQIPHPLDHKHGAVRLDTTDVEASLSAIEAAKKFPVPAGEEPGHFYYRKAQEIQSQGKGQQK